MRRAFAVVVMLLFAALPMLAATRMTKTEHRAQVAAKRAKAAQRRAALKALHQQLKNPVNAGRITLRRQPPTRTSTTSTLSVRKGMVPTTPAPPTTNIGLLAATSIYQAPWSYEVASGDFDGDGNKDVVFDAYDSNWNYVLFTKLGKGDGTFEPATPLTTPGGDPVAYSEGRYLFAADLNGDGKDDIVVIQDSGVDVYMNDGSGKFAQYVSYPVPGGGGWYDDAYALKPNANGRPDIYVVFSNTFSHLINAGDGTFTVDSSVQFTSDWRECPVITDFDGDGNLDIAAEVYSDTTGGYALEVWKGDGVGGFGTPAKYDKWVFSMDQSDYNDSYAQVLADVNGDGKLDVVSMDDGDYFFVVGVYVQQADGKFVSKGPFFAVSGWPDDFTAADVDGDGKAEVLIPDEYAGTLSVLKGSASGSLQLWRSYGVGGYPWEGPYMAPAVADFNKDGKPDLVVANYGWDLAYLQNLGDGTFRGAQHAYPAPTTGLYYYYTYPGGVTFGDFNGDGLVDVATGNWYAHETVGISVYLNQGGGVLGPGTNYGSGGYMLDVAAGDINGDGKMDLVAVEKHYGNVDVFLGRGDGTFVSPNETGLSYSNSNNWEWPFGVTVADVDGKNGPDVLVRNEDYVGVLLNDGNGGLLPVVEYETYDYNWDSGQVYAADVNGDNIPDLIVEDLYGVDVFLGTGDGTFETSYQWVDFGSYDIADIAIGDFDGDGKIDIAAACDDGVAVALNKTTDPTTVTFDAPVLYGANTRDEEWFGNGPSTKAIAVADFDGDGKPDIAVSNQNYGTVSLLYNKGDGTGTFYDAVEYLSSINGFTLGTADLNGDGAPDVVQVVSGDEEYGTGVTVMLNAGGVKWTVTPTQSAAGATSALAVSLSPSVKGVTAVPSGNLTVTEGTTELGTGTLAAGSATITFTSSLTGASAHILTVAYGGDTNFAASSLKALAVAGATDYDLSADKTAVTIKAGQSALINITVTPKNGFTGTISFSCGTLPTGVGCSFSPSSVTPNGVDPVKVVLVVTTTAAVSASAAPGPMHNNSQLPLWASLWGMGAMGMVLAGGTSRKRKAMMLLALLALGLLVLLAGCGHVTDTVEKTVYVQQATPAGTSTVQVNATAFGSAKSLPLTVTIN